MKIARILRRHPFVKIAQYQDKPISIGQYAERVSTLGFSAPQSEEFFKKLPGRSNIRNCDVHMVEFHLAIHLEERGGRGKLRRRESFGRTERFQRSGAGIALSHLWSFSFAR